MDDQEDLPKNREALLKSLDKMIASGRVTPQEAEKLRGTSDSAEFDQAMTTIRVRHASVRLSEAVSQGKMTQSEADGYLEQLRAGEHPKSLRSHLRKLLPHRNS